MTRAQQSLSVLLLVSSVCLIRLIATIASGHDEMLLTPWGGFASGF